MRRKQARFQSAFVGSEFCISHVGFPASENFSTIKQHFTMKHEGELSKPPPKDAVKRYLKSVSG